LSEAKMCFRSSGFRYKLVLMRYFKLVWWRGSVIRNDARSWESLHASQQMRGLKPEPVRADRLRSSRQGILWGTES
jgi:hypothetical protein